MSGKSSRRKGQRFQPDSDGPLRSGFPVPESILPGHEQADLCEAISQRPRKAIRLRPSDALGAGVALDLPFETEPVPWFAGGRLVSVEPQPGRYLQHSAGCWFIQDAGSMLALQLLRPEPHEHIADICASPGGKATGILEVVGPGSGFLLANEPIHGRLPPLQWTLARVGFPRYVTSQYDPEELSTILPGQFDGVLVDAPCTGQTLVGRGRQSTMSFSPRQIAHSAARQQRILQHAAELVRPGGRLVYSTCTFAVEENEAVIAAFLEANSNWDVQPDESLNEWLSPLSPGGYRLWPHRQHCAGAFAVRLRRNDSAANEAPHAEVQKHRVCHPWLTSLPKDFPADVVAEDLSDLMVRQQGSQWYGTTSQAPPWTQTLNCQGTELAFQPARTWQPGHALSLRRDPGWQPTNTIELSDAEARSCLQGNILPARNPGWHVVRWNGHPLGWVHSNAMRSNNALPTAARLNFAAQ